MIDWKAAERRVRHGLARALLRPFGVRARPADRVDLDRVRRVLIVRPNFRMGNLLLTTPALTAVRDALPDARVDLLTTTAYRDLLRGHPDVDRVWTLDRGLWLRPWSLAGLVLGVRRAGYDLVVDAAQGESLTGALLARASGGRWRVGPRPSRYESLYDVRVPRDPTVHHRVRRLLRLLEGVGIEAGTPPMSIALAPAERAWAERRWRDLDLPADDPVVGVNVGARGSKRWPMERFLEVVRRLEADGIRAVVFAGPEDLDRLDAIDVRRDDVAVDTTHDVRRFAALLERCAVVVTGDTGPMHLAVAVGTPTVAIFLRENHPVFAPLGERHRRLVGVEGGIEPDAVIDAVKSALGARAEPRAEGAGGSR